MYLRSVRRYSYNGCDIYVKHIVATNGVAQLAICSNIASSGLLWRCNKVRALERFDFDKVSLLHRCKGLSDLLTTTRALSPIIASKEPSLSRKF